MLPDHIRAVVFDAVGTVLHPVKGAPKIYADAAARYGIHDTPEAIRQRFVAAYLVEEYVDKLCDWRTDEAREMRRWQSIVFAALPGAPQECFEELYSHFTKPEAWFAPPEAADVFAALQACRLTLGLGSNYDTRLQTVLAGRPELDALSKHVVISSVVGVRKPGRGFFGTLTAELGFDSEDIAFVGDDLENDYEGAEEAGMFPVLLDPLGKHPGIKNRIKNLRDLTRLNEPKA